MGKASLKKSVVKAAPPTRGVSVAPKSAGKPVSKPAPAVVVKAAAKAAPAPKVAARSAAPIPAKSKPVQAVAVKAPPIVIDERKDARANRAQKPQRIESKPSRPLLPAAPRVEQVSSSGDSKPKKNQAGLSPKELEHFRDLLLEKRRELVGDMSSMEKEALQATESNLSTLPIHMADMGTDNYEQEFTLGLVEKDRVLLLEINQALAKIQNGSYGLCQGSGKPIAKVRLEAQPWARFSIEFARLQEKHGMR